MIRAVAALGLVAWLVAPAAHAQAPEPQTTQTTQTKGPQEQESHVVAPIKVEATSDGKATASFGFGYLHGTGPGTLIGGLVDYRVATSGGLATLLGIDDSLSSTGTKPWALGGNLSWVSFGSAAVIGPPPTVPSPVRVKAVQACKAELDAGVAPSAFKDAYARAVTAIEGALVQEHQGIDVQRLCPAGRQALEKFEKDAAGREGGVPAEQRAEARKAALVTCIRQCAAGLEPAFCTVLGTTVHEEVPANFAPVSDLCPAGMAIEDEAAKAALRKPLPPLMIDVGARVGQTEFTYRQPAVGTDQVLTEATKARWNVRAGASGAHIIYGASADWAPTVEWLAVWGREWTASTKKARWCAPAGVVRRNPDDPNDTTSDPAQRCDEAPLGGPTRAEAVELALLAGAIDRQGGAWRWAAGPRLAIPTNDESTNRYTAGLTAFAIFRFTSDQSGVDLEYKGLLRIGPSFVVEKPRRGKMNTKALVTLSVLGDRFLFSQAFDEN